MFALADSLRRAQGDALAAFGLGPNEHAYRVIAARPRWRLRRYAGDGKGAPVLIVAAPIKRPYIWDLAPGTSVVRLCARHGLKVHLLEWLPPASGEAGLDQYVAEALGTAAGLVADAAGGRPPFLMGHSLGGTFAAMYAALEPRHIAGLVLLGAPLCFAPGASRFRDALVRTVPPRFTARDVVPGTVLSQVCALASPETFIWSRFLDAAFSAPDAAAFSTHSRVERWALDELAVPGLLVNQILGWLYREDRFFRETLAIQRRTIGPSRVRVPVFAAANPADDIAPPATMKPFLDAMPGTDTRFLAYPREWGVGLQHLGILVGRRALAHTWPRILAWLDERSLRPAPAGEAEDEAHEEQHDENEE
jgi:polyhydroxyalkanoate synthase